MKKKIHTFRAVVFPAVLVEIVGLTLFVIFYFNNFAGTRDVISPEYVIGGAVGGNMRELVLESRRFVVQSMFWQECLWMSCASLLKLFFLQHKLYWISIVVMVLSQTKK